jgi:hypothetical protein
MPSHVNAVRLRRRADDYRHRAKGEPDPIKAEEYLRAAELLDREAANWQRQDVPVELLKSWTGPLIDAALVRIFSSYN